MGRLLKQLFFQESQYTFGIDVYVDENTMGCLNGGGESQRDCFPAARE